MNLIVFYFILQVLNIFKYLEIIPFSANIKRKHQGYTPLWMIEVKCLNITPADNQFKFILKIERYYETFTPTSCFHHWLRKQYSYGTPVFPFNPLCTSCNCLFSIFSPFVFPVPFVHLLYTVNSLFYLILRFRCFL